MENIFSEFLEVSKKEWLEKVEKDLKGKDLKSLNWAINQDWERSPFAHKDDLKNQPKAISGLENNDWELAEMIQVNDYQKANDLAKEALEGGCTALIFNFHKSPSTSDLAVLLKEVRLDWISSHYSVNDKNNTHFVEKLLSYIQEANYVLNDLNGSFSLHGAYPDYQQLIPNLQQLPKFKFFTINAQSFYNGTEQVVDELAQTLKAGNDLLVNLNNQGLKIEQFYQNIQFSISIGESYFLNIAKIRALKLCWNQILNAWSEQIDLYPDIETHFAKETQTKDKNTNLIKATTQCMSAIIGGSARIVVPFNDTIENQGGTTFSRRIARNIQHLMKMESYLDRVVDPAAGSYYVEQLTDNLAAKAWSVFQTAS